MTQRVFLTGLILVFITALAIRVTLTVAFVGLGAPPDANANPDQMDYELFAYRMSVGEGYTLPDGTPTARRTPGTSLTLLPVYTVFGRSHAMGRLWFCFLSALTCLIVAFGARQYFSRGVALIAASALALYPGHFYFAMHFLSETPFALHLAAAVSFTLAAMRDRRWQYDVAAGACWALTALDRPNVLLVAPIALLAVLMARGVRREQFTRWGVQVATAMLVLSPWVIRNAIEMGKPTLTTLNGIGLYTTYNDVTFTPGPNYGGWVRGWEIADIDGHTFSGNEVEKDEQARAIAMQYIREHKAELPGVMLARLWRLVTPVWHTPNRMVKYSFAAAWIAAIPFILIGLWATWRLARGAAVVLMLPLAATIATAIMYYGLIRFRESTAPVFLIFAAVGAHRILMWIAQRRRGGARGEQVDVIAKLPQEQRRAA